MAITISYGNLDRVQVASTQDPDCCAVVKRTHSGDKGWELSWPETSHAEFYREAYEALREAVVRLVAYDKALTVQQGVRERGRAELEEALDVIRNQQNEDGVEIVFSND